MCANISEGSVFYISRKDRINKFLIALKELSETISWIEILFGINEITENDYIHFRTEYNEIEKILSKSISTMKKKLHTTED